MPDILLYQAETPDETNAAAYALLKYLGTCNLKPPATTRLIIYTDQPALVEAYGAFFHQYEFRTPQGAGKTATLQECCATTKGNLIYFGGASYPVQPLEPVFAAIEKGAFYADVKQYRQDQQMVSEIVLLGINTNIQELTLPLPSKTNTIAFAEQYDDVKDFHILLRTFFRKYGEESIPNLVKLAAAIDINKIREQKSRYEQLPFFKKITRKVTGKGWNISNYVR